MLENASFDFAAHWEYVVLYAATAAIASGVVLDFALHARRAAAAVSAERNAVATLSMTLFFVVLFLVGQSGIAGMHPAAAADLATRAAGSLMLVFAAVVNLGGRLALGRFWSNQIEILERHEVIRAWPYSWSRHPLYGSLVIFGVGMGFVLLSPLAVAATLLFFVPAMYYRAGREEALLLAACGEEYRRFQREVPMLLPQLPEGPSRVARGLLGLMLAWATLRLHLDVFVVAAALALGLSFVMQRPEFRLAYKIKPAVILACAATAFHEPQFDAILWLPTAAALVSVTGHCPGTLLIRRLQGPERGENP